MVCHRTLVELIHDTPLPRGIVRWLSNYLNGRQTTTLFNSQESPHKIVHCGVPKGSVLSPNLFNFYVHDALTLPYNVRFKSCADDFHPFFQSPDVEAASRSLNDYLHHLFNFFTSRKLSFASSKGSVTLFSSSNKDFNRTPRVLLNNEPFPPNKNPKILGVPYALLHTKRSTDKARRRLGVLKALAGSSWGQTKETLLLTYKALIRPILDYASPAWSHAASKTSINDLQVTQK